MHLYHGTTPKGEEHQIERAFQRRRRKAVAQARCASTVSTSVVAPEHEHLIGLKESDLVGSALHFLDFSLDLRKSATSWS